MGLLGVLLLWRTVPRLTVLPAKAAPHMVTGSSYCVAALHSALLLDGKSSQELAWLQFRPDTQELEEQIDKCVPHVLRPSMHLRLCDTTSPIVLSNLNASLSGPRAP